MKFTLKFPKNHYTLLYFKYMKRAKRKNDIRKVQLAKKTIHFEKHHIFPKCLFPQYKNTKSNLVILTLREHYIAHVLLIKIFENEMAYKTQYIKMLQALHRFYICKIKEHTCSNIFEKATLYEKYKEEYFNLPRIPWNKGLKGVQVAWNKGITGKDSHAYKHVVSEETREKISLHRKGKKLSEESLKKLSQSLKGRTVWNKGLRGYHINKHNKLSDEAKHKISIGNKGKIAWNKGLTAATDARVAKYNVSSKRTKGLKWYNNGTTNKMFDENDVLPGFVKGRLKNENK